MGNVKLFCRIFNPLNTSNTQIKFPNSEKYISVPADPVFFIIYLKICIS